MEILRVDQTVVDYKIKDQTKTDGSRGNVPLPPDIEAEMQAYIEAEGITDLLFPSSTGTAISPDNYLDRVLKPLGELAGIEGLNHQVLRRTTATHFQKHGKVKDAQALLLHTNASTTLKHYQKVLDESLVSGVAVRFAYIDGVLMGRFAISEECGRKLLNQLDLWWARQDSNLRPPACEAGALTS
jgi:integrase